MRWGGVARHNPSRKAEKAVCEPLMVSCGHSAKGAVHLQGKVGVKRKVGSVCKGGYESQRGYAPETQKDSRSCPDALSEYHFPRGVVAKI